MCDAKRSQSVKTSKRNDDATPHSLLCGSWDEEATSALSKRGAASIEEGDTHYDEDDIRSSLPCVADDGTYYSCRRASSESICEALFCRLV